ncbi:protein of unknown function DUF1656 [Rhodomicrobium vannielii ATCC 17100]|uniref:DUF1656 domain-containing protein n=1 Tax=Rhodomicrobium vannielii (strain ATCC 17100 / DSM 162 / LMG 4299 / NCIMB 10020 / ATH 3.1.1) TaxID=648757 RepID=E3I839_RHOVT|nr:DUF1656 domain-containing protein [Rhodomicrobium vannielii]ADP71965.1 protein of unknown function DUF1656 [Rhodomicrobium vannielii ATCC 17100]
MIGELDIYGVFVPALLLWMLIAYAVTAMLRSLCQRLGLYRYAWHRALFDISLYFIVLGAVVALETSLLPGS